MSAIATISSGNGLSRAEPLTLTRPSVPARSGKSNSPFRYPGGKFYARKLILERLPAHESYCEPFAGGASIFFAKESVHRSVLNDLDEDVVNAMLQIRDNVEDLIQLLEGIDATKDLHAYYKCEYKPADDLERAFRWYYLNRTSYSGIMRRENCYWGYGPKYSMRPENWPPHLRTASDKLRGVHLLCQDFEEVIDAQPDGTLLFVDPPYFDADQQKFYNCTFSEHDHHRLAESLKRNDGRLHFLLTYDDHPAIRSLYDWTASIQEQQWNYTISRTDDQKNGRKKEHGYRNGRSKGRELFISNQPSEPTQ